MDQPIQAQTESCTDLREQDKWYMHYMYYLSS
jgi:hypothetical protein